MSEMKKNNFAPGLILITIGALFLLRNMGYIDWWSMGSMLRLWPLVLVVIGINTIFRDNSVVSAITWVSFIIIAVAFSILNPVQPPWNRMVHVTQTVTEDFQLPMEGALEKGILKLSTGALKLRVESTENDLLYVKDFPGAPDIQVRELSNGRVKEIVMRSTHTNVWGSRDVNYDSLVQINKDLPWEIEASIGAAASEMDFRDLVIKKLSMDVGAGDFRLLLSQPEEEDVNVNINAGASQVVLELPRDVNARIEAQNVLAQTTLNDRYWNQEGKVYYSADYDETQPVIDINVKMGVGHLEIISR